MSNRKEKTSRANINLAHKWLEGTYMEGAQVLDVKVFLKTAQNLKRGVITILWKNTTIEMKVFSDDKAYGYRDLTYIIRDNQREEIDGMTLKRMAAMEVRK